MPTLTLDRIIPTPPLSSRRSPVTILEDKRYAQSLLDLSPFLFSYPLSLPTVEHPMDIQQAEGTLKKFSLGRYALPSGITAGANPQAEHLYHMAQALHDVSGGTPVTQALAQIPEYRQALVQQGIPLDKFVQATELIARMERREISESQAFSALRQLATAPVTSQLGQLSQTIQLPTTSRQEREAQIGAAQPRIGAWYDRTAKSAGIPSDKVKSVFKGFSDEQLAAVEAPDQTRVVKAGGGAGKTDTLVAMITDAVVNRGANPRDFTLLVATHSAEGELVSRLTTIGNTIPQMRLDWAGQVKTFHAKAMSTLNQRVMQASGQAMTPLQAMGMGAYTPFPSSSSSSSRKAAPKNAEEAFRAQTQEEYKYFQNLLTHHGVRVQQAQSLFQQIQAIKSEHGYDGPYKDMGIRGAQSWAAGKKEAFESLLYMYEKARMNDPQFKLPSQTGPHYDLADSIILAARAGERGFTKPFQHTSVDEMQDPQKQMYRMLAAQTQRSSGFRFFAGDEGQRTIKSGGGYQAGRAIQQMFPSAKAFPLTGNYRLGPINTALYSATQMEHVLDNRGRAPFQVSMRAGGAEAFPTMYTATSFKEVNKQMFADYLHRQGLTHTQVTGNIQAGMHPLAGASSAGSMPFVFQMKEQRKYFLKSIEHDFAQSVGPAKAKVAVRQMFNQGTPQGTGGNQAYALLINQTLGKSFPHIFGDWTRVGSKWSDADYMEQMGVVASRPTVQSHIYSSQTNIAGSNYNLVPDTLHGQAVPTGMATWYQWMLHNLTSVQGVFSSSLSVADQQLLSSPMVSRVQAPTQDLGAFSRFVEDAIKLIPPSRPAAGAGIGTPAVHSATSVGVTSSSERFGDESTTVNGISDRGSFQRILGTAKPEPDKTRIDLIVGYARNLLEQAGKTTLHMKGMIALPGNQGFMVNEGASTWETQDPDELSIENLMKSGMFGYQGGKERKAANKEITDYMAPTTSDDWSPYFNEKSRLMSGDHDRFGYRGKDEQKLRQGISDFLGSDLVRQHTQIKPLIEGAFTRESVRNVVADPKNAPNTYERQVFTQSPVLKTIQDYAYAQRSDAGQHLLQQVNAAHEQGGLDPFIRGLVNNPKDDLLREEILNKAADVVSFGYLPPEAIEAIKSAAEEFNYPTLIKLIDAYGDTLYSADNSQIGLRKEDWDYIKANHPREHALLSALSEKSGVGLGNLEDPAVQKQVSMLPYVAGQMVRAAGEQGQALGIPLAESQYAPFTTEMSALSRTLEKAGILDPMALRSGSIDDILMGVSPDMSQALFHQLPGALRGKALPILGQDALLGGLSPLEREVSLGLPSQSEGVGVGLEGYQKRLEDLLSISGHKLSPEQARGYRAELEQVRSLRKTLSDSSFQLESGHLLNMVHRAATGESAIDKNVKGEHNHPYARFMAPLKNQFGEGNRTLGSIQELVSSLQEGTRHVQGTGMLSRASTNRILEALGHDPSEFGTLSDLENLAGFGEGSSLPLTALTAQFPSEQKNLLAQFTRFPFRQGQTVAFMGGMPGFTDIAPLGQEKAGLRAGMVGTLHPINKGISFGLPTDYGDFKKHGLFTGKEWKEHGPHAQDKEFLKQVAEPLAMLRMKGGKQYPVRLSQVTPLSAKGLYPDTQEMLDWSSERLHKGTIGRLRERRGKQNTRVQGWLGTPRGQGYLARQAQQNAPTPALLKPSRALQQRLSKLPHYTTDTSRSFVMQGGRKIPYRQFLQGESATPALSPSLRAQIEGKRGVFETQAKIPVSNTPPSEAFMPEGFIGGSLGAASPFAEDPDAIEQLRQSLLRSPGNQPYGGSITPDAMVPPPQLEEPLPASQLEMLAKGLREGNANWGIHPPSDEQKQYMLDPAMRTVLEGGPGTGKTATAVRGLIHQVASGTILPKNVLGLSSIRSATSRLAGEFGRYRKLLPRGKEYDFMRPRTFASVASSTALHKAQDENGKDFFPILQKLGYKHLTGDILGDPTAEDLYGKDKETQAKMMGIGQKAFIAEQVNSHLVAQGKRPWTEQQIKNAQKYIGETKKGRMSGYGAYERIAAGGTGVLQEPYTHDIRKGLQDLASGQMTHPAALVLHEQGLRGRGGMDWDDLFSVAVEAYQKFGPDALPDIFKHIEGILIDEGQDATPLMASLQKGFIGALSANNPRVTVAMDVMQSLTQGMGGIPMEEIRGSYRDILGIPEGTPFHELTQNFRSDADVVAFHRALLASPHLQNIPQSPPQVSRSGQRGLPMQHIVTGTQPEEYRQMFRGMLGATGVSSGTMKENIKEGRHPLSGATLSPSEIAAIVPQNQYVRLFEHVARQELQSSLGVQPHEASAILSQIMRQGMPPADLDMESDEGKAAQMQMPLLKFMGSRGHEFSRVFTDVSFTGLWQRRNDIEGYKRNLNVGLTRAKQGGQNVVGASEFPFTSSEVDKYIAGGLDLSKPEVMAKLRARSRKNAPEMYQGKGVPRFFRDLHQSAQGFLQQWGHGTSTPAPVTSPSSLPVDQLTASPGLAEAWEQLKNQDPAKHAELSTFFQNYPGRLQSGFEQQTHTSSPQEYVKQVSGLAQKGYTRAQKEGNVYGMVKSGEQHARAESLLATPDAFSTWKQGAPPTQQSQNVTIATKSATINLPPGGSVSISGTPGSTTLSPLPPGITPVRTSTPPPPGSKWALPPNAPPPSQPPGSRGRGYSDNPLGGPSPVIPQAGPPGPGSSPSGGSGGGGGRGGYNNAASQFGRYMARLGYELQFMGKFFGDIVTQSLTQGSEYRLATGGLPGSGANGTEGFYNFAKGPGISNYQSNTLPMYSTTQIAQGIQGMYASTGYRGGSAPLGTMTDIMGLSAITGMDPTQLMGSLAYLSGSSGQGQNMGSYSTSIGMLGNLFGNVLSPANVTPTLGALSSVVPTLNGISPGSGSQTGQAMAFFQLAQGAGMTPQNFGDVSSLLGSLAQVGSAPNLQQQYTLQKLGFPLTADTSLAQYQQEQTSREMQIASLGLQQNINEGVPGINGGRPTGAPLSLPHLQIQIDQAQITMDKAELTMGGLQLAAAQVGQQGAQLQYQYGQASYNFNLAQQNALYGPIGKDYSQLAGYSFQQNQLVAGRNSTSPEIGTMFTPQNVSGLRNQEFYAGLQNQQQSLILGRSPLLSDALFQQQMKYIAQQADYYKQELALRNQQREFDMVWQKRLLDQQGAQVAAQGRIVAYQGYIYSLQQDQFKLEQEKSVYDQKQAAIAQQFLARQEGDLEAINTALNQFLNGQGPVGGQNLQPQDLVQKMADELKSGALNPSSLQGTLRGLGLSPQDQSTMYQLVTQLSRSSETLQQMTQNMNNASDQQVVALFNKLKLSGAFNIQVQTAGQQNAALQQGGIGPDWNQLTANTANIATAESTIAKVLAPGTPYLQDISAIANTIGPLAVGVGTLANVIGLFLARGGGGFTGGGGGGGVPGVPSVGNAPGGPGKAPSGPDYTNPATYGETPAPTTKPPSGVPGGGGLPYAGISPEGVRHGQVVTINGKLYVQDVLNPDKLYPLTPDKSPSIFARMGRDVGLMPGGGLSNPWQNLTDPNVQFYSEDTSHPVSAKQLAAQAAIYAKYAKAGGPGTVSTQEANQHLKNMEAYLHQVQTNTGSTDTKTTQGNTIHTSNNAKLISIAALHTQANNVQQRQILIQKNSDSNLTVAATVQAASRTTLDNISALHSSSNNEQQRQTLILKNSDASLDRIKADEDAWAKLATFTKGTGGTSTMNHPGFNTPGVNADFHQRMNYGIHQGVDFAAVQGTPIGAFNPGRVKNTGFYPWGGEVDVDIGHGLTERYLHLSQIGVMKGQPLLPRQRMGLTGGGTPASGLGYWSSGAHSHVQIDAGDINHGLNPWPIWAMLGSTNLAAFYQSGWGTTKGHGGHAGTVGEPRQLAEGGIAMKRVMAEIGEGKEPEAVLPLSRLSTLLKAASSSPVSQPGGAQPVKAIQVSKLADKFEIHVHTTSAKLDDQAIDDLGAQFFDILTTQLQKL